MMRTIIFMTLALFTHFALSDSAIDYPSIWKCDSPKPQWYCDENEQPVQSAQTAPSPDQAKSIHLEIKDIRTAEDLRKEFQRRIDKANMDPSPENMHDFLEINYFAQEKSATFGDAMRRMVWQTPEFDYSLKRPVNNVAIRSYDDNRTSDEELHLRSLAQKHGLIFFFRSDCPYCHAMAPTIKMLADKFGIDVLPVSIDGLGLPEFPNPADGRGKAEAWGIETVPALFIGSKETGDKAPIGYGVMAYSEIVSRIFVLTNTQPGQTF